MSINGSLIFTNDKCQGCNRCISVCPVLTANRSINGERGKQRIEIQGENCIQCGDCLHVCEHHARSFQDDTERFFRDLKGGTPISVLIAPAFLANYPNEYGRILGGLKKLGVKHFISVSFGADITTWGYINYISRNSLAGGISQPCPAAVNYVEHYVPELIPKLVPIHSPMMCAAIYTKKYMKITDKLAFISPCIAKKTEIDDPNTNGYISYNVTFNHLMRYVNENKISGPEISDEIEYGLGSIYPMPGGLKENVHWFCGEDIFIRQVEGTKHAYKFLRDYKNRVNSGGQLPFMVDILNCGRGCIYGTGIETRKYFSEDTFYDLLRIKERSKKNKTGDPFSRKLSPAKRLKMLNRKFSALKLEDFMRKYTDKSAAVSLVEPTQAQINEVFNRMQKHTEEDRKINCGACGYNNCREMAKVIFNNCNTPENCVHYIKSRVQAISESLEVSNREIAARNQEISKFIHKFMEEDFETLDNSIKEMMNDNNMNANESSVISKDVSSVAEFCSVLNNSLSSINSLLKELEQNNAGVSSIAEQTNIVALNASVEAVRSGQAGRSFAVVAAEVKNLAKTSQELSEKSSDNQNKISAAIRSISNDAEELAKFVDDIKNRANNLAASSQDIASEANSVQNLSAQMRHKLETLDHA